MVICRDRGDLNERLGELLSVRFPVDVDVESRSGPLRESEVEGEATLQQPSAGCGRVEACEKSVETRLACAPVRAVRCLRLHVSGVSARALAEMLRRRGISRCAVREKAFDECPHSSGAAVRRRAEAPGCRQAAVERLADSKLDLLQLGAGLE